ncbi:metal ABC transporter solute-binding protein, Zn/Mn family [Sutcliffiella rhizosphaerae]|uniref:High-affinity zinc uptake system binding-protein ZnuA n=1 Tax=Sutcliffiella rhizosphaerae TaxID=2880967 RepID=A0ABM8YRF4_9BACI|nr:zinc ABC transporter substrate-binding protein [Sutcliffiella rhizosphaerae]CAG9622416.1 High-affinity zinc uptake system binding-protein ZnuA [Sutcliffiella rhizosphaerae]
MKVKSILVILLLTTFTFLVGCNSNNKASDGNEKLIIYTTIFPLEDFAHKIGADHIDIKSVLPPGADAHTYEPSTRTMSEMASANAFIYTGVGVEGFADKAKDVLKNEDVTIVAAGHGIELRGEDEHDHADEAHDDHEHDHADEAHDDHEHDHADNAHDDHEHDHADEAHDDHEHDHADNSHDDHDHDHSDGDPHVWLDPTLSIKLAENIKDALIELKPDAKEDFEANFESLKNELEKLDGEYKEIFETAQTNKLLVSHAAYGYWESRYGLDQISVTGLSPTQEPSQKQLTEIIATAKENNIKYVIFDQNITGKIAEVVQNEIGAEALVLHNLEALTDEDVQNDEDYFSLMRQNLEILKKALN